MKRYIYLMILSIFISIISGCNSTKPNPILYKDSTVDSSSESTGEDLAFKIEKISLSKSYQNIKPNMEVVKKGLNYKLIASLGLIESSGVEVSRISKNNKEINIYIKNKDKPDTNELVVPNIVINLENPNIKELDDVKLAIIGENYKPIKIKLDVNEAINIVNAECKIFTNNPPQIGILKEDDKYLWKLDYYNIFDKTSVSIPVINLFAVIDADSGEILTLDKDYISSYIDNGYILDYIANENILYKKLENSPKGNPLETLWSYNIKTKKNKLLYTSSENLITAKFNTQKKIAFIESSDKKNQLFIIDPIENKPYKISFKAPIDPQIAQWKDNDHLLLLERNKNDSIIYNYNITENTEANKFVLEKRISDIIIQGDYYLISEEDTKSERSLISLTKDFKEFTYNESGFKAKFIAPHLLAFIKVNDETDKHILHIFDINEKELLRPIDLNVSNFLSLNKDTMIIIENNQSNKDYTLHKYNLKKDELTAITNIGSDRILFNSENNTIYVNSSLPFSEKNPEIIYSINLSEMTNYKPLEE